jgi:hypothetical protein
MPLTLLYGPTGVGKSSVLMAGVIPHFQRSPTFTIVRFAQWHDQALLPELKAAIAQELKRSADPSLELNLELPLDALIENGTRRTRRGLVLIFDQFEEYFLYHPAHSSDQFEDEFARSVNRSEGNVNFLIALREESLSQLDRFQGRIGNLMDNLVGLQHLNRTQAIDAITKPLEVYNQKHSNEPPIAIDPALVDSLIDQVRLGQIVIGPAGAGGITVGSSATGDDLTRFEMPFLQLVLTRLWEEEMRVGSRMLRLETLERLGGALRIVSTNLDSTMARLAPSDQQVASDVFRMMVTPSGAKIAYTAQDLASLTEHPLEVVQRVLKALTDQRLLRPIAPPIDQPTMTRYEIFHDVLAAGVLDWRRRFMEEHRARQPRALNRIVLITLVISLLANIIFVIQLFANN